MKKSYTIPSIYFFVFYFSCLLNLYSQQEVIKDSLSEYSYRELSDKFYNSKNDSLKAVYYANLYIKKAQQQKNIIEIGNGFYYLSDITKDSSYFLSYWNKVINQKKNSKNNFYTSISYLQMGDFYFQFGDKSKALEKYLQANKIIKNDSLKYIVINRIAMLKKRNGDVESAISYYKKSYNYFKNKNSHTLISPEYFSLIIHLSLAYSKINKHDSAYYYNDKLIKVLKHKSNSIYYGYAISNRGIIEFNRSNFKKAIKNFKESIPYLISDENYNAVSAAYYRIASSFKDLDNKSAAINYYLKVDSLYNKLKSYDGHQRETFKQLINYYKSNKKERKQLEYINKYIKVDSVLTRREKSIARELIQNYDIPNLLEEKKNIENRLKNSLSTTKKWVIGISLLTTFLFIFLIHQSRKRKLYKKRFLQLVKEQENNLEETTDTVVKQVSNNIPENIIQHILKSLEQFEINQTFILTDLTLASLASDFKTNSKYLSQVINQYKNQSFSNYVNSLRIIYTVEKLKTDSRFRKYTIHAIANDVGFNNSESFSRAFYKKTGIKPSYFIKEFEKNQI